MSSARILQSLLAALLGLGLIIGLAVLTGISFSALRTVLAQTKWLAFIGILACSLLYVILGAIKWRVLADKPPPQPFFYMHYTAQAMLLGQFLPQPIATVVTRAAVMRWKQAAPLKAGFLNAVYDLGFDFLVAAILAPVSLCQWIYGFGLGLWFTAGCAVLLMTGGLLAWLHKIVPLPWFSSRGPGLLFLLSAARFALVIMRLELGVMAVSLAIPYGVVAYATPLATLPSLLPLTPASLGIAEWSWAYLLTLWHIPAEAGALYALSFRILVFVAQVLVSGFCLLLYRNKFKTFQAARN